EGSVAAVIVFPATYEMVKGDKRLIFAHKMLSNDSRWYDLDPKEVKWTSSPPNAIKFSGAEAEALLDAPLEVTITAQDTKSGKSGTAKVKLLHPRRPQLVSLKLFPEDREMHIGERLPFTAKGVFGRGTGGFANIGGEFDLTKANNLKLPWGDTVT